MLETIFDEQWLSMAELFMRFILEQAAAELQRKDFYREKARSVGIFSICTLFYCMPFCWLTFSFSIFGEKIERYRFGAREMVYFQ